MGYMTDAVSDCYRIDFAHLQEEAVDANNYQDSIMLAVRAIQTLLIEGSTFYIGITFCPEHRMRTIRDAYIDPSTGESLEADASRAHFPQHWKSMTVLAHATRHIGLMERDMIHRFKARLTNSPKHGGSGTAQQHLFLYIAHNSGQSCKCHLCKKGRQESSGFTSESDADIAGPTWRQKKAEEEAKEAPPKRKRLRDETSLPQLKPDLPLRPPLPEKRADNYDPNEVPTHNVETIESYIRAAGLCDHFNGIPVQCCRRTTIRLSFH